MSTKYPLMTLALLVAVGTLACGPSAEDKSNMDKKMELERARTKVFTEAKDCAVFEEQLGSWAETNKDELNRLDAWWVDLGDGKKDKLIAEHQTEWDAQTAAMAMGVMSCPDEFERAMAKLE